MKSGETKIYQMNKKNKNSKNFMIKLKKKQKAN